MRKCIFNDRNKDSHGNFVCLFINNLGEISFYAPTNVIHYAPMGVS